MFERILIPLDGTEIAEVAIPYVEEVASKFGSEVILYHTYGREYREQKHIYENYLDRLADTVKKNIRKEGAAGFKVTTKVGAGEPADNICHLVEKDRIDLIIMTSVSASGIKISKMLGSVTDHVCRTAPIPVLLVRPQDVLRIESKKQLINRILIPLDGSDFSKQALPVAEAVATKLKVPIIVFQMVQSSYPYVSSDFVSKIDYSKLGQGEEQMVREEMAALAQKLTANGLVAVAEVSSGTDAANEIIQTTKDSDIDLIVMSSHGRSGLGRWLLGSVAEKVLRYGETPLLLVNVRGS